MGDETHREFEDYPLTRVEYITAMVHHYRGEMSRAIAWRKRLDSTTNWSIGATGAVLSVAILPEASDIIVLIGMLLVFHFLAIEARRYRFFDLFNARVRKIEENFYAPLLLRDLASPQIYWGKLLAHDLLVPHFKVTLLEALGLRLIRNYVPIFLLLDGFWVLKLYRLAVSEETERLKTLVGHAADHVDPPSFAALYQQMAEGPIPSWFVLSTFVLFNLALIGLIVFVHVAKETVSEEVEGFADWEGEDEL